MDSAEMEIEALYREIEDLDAKRRAAFARLRQLQEQEAQRFRTLVEDRMEMKPGEGKAILDEVKRFLAEHGG